MFRLNFRIQHPYRCITIFIAILWLIGCIYIDPVDTAPSAVALILCIALAFACYYFPVSCSLVLIVFNCIGEYAIQGFAAYTSIFLFMAVVLFSYETSNIAATILAVVLCVYTIVEGTFRPQGVPMKGVISFIALYLFLALLGRSLRWNDERNKQLKKALQAQAE